MQRDWGSKKNKTSLKEFCEKRGGLFIPPKIFLKVIE